jgi:8-oxo-dGTP pyrophosphatase MutT (NUDIX family)/predicted transcriptional regulator
MQKNDIHSIQKSILRVLIFKTEARFSELNTEHVSSDLFSFHVKSLIEAGLLEKTSTGNYQLTAAGKEFANRFDTDTKKIVLERQAKIGVCVTCVKDEGKERLYLVHQRLKQPYYGFYGFITGKVKWGEVLSETAERELLEEAGLRADLKHVGVYHKMDYSTAGVLLEDKYFFLFRGDAPRGKLIETFEGGKNMWLTGKEYLAMPDLFDNVKETLSVMNQDALKFYERKYTVAKY